MRIVNSGLKITATILRLLIFGLIGCFVYSDSDFYLPNLLDDDALPQEYYRAGKLGSHQGVLELAEYARASQDRHWLEMSAQLLSPDAMYALGEMAKVANKKKQYFRQAAQIGHVEAQFQLAMLLDAEQREYWLTQAAQQDSLKSQIALYHWYMLNDREDLAHPWMKTAALRDGQSAFLLGLAYWRDKEYAKGIQWTKSALQLGFDDAKTEYQLMQRFWPNNHYGVQQVNHSAVCKIRIQPIATSLESMVKIQQHIHSYESDKRLASLSMCMNPPLWIEDSRFTCDSNWQRQGRLGCELNALNDYIMPENFTHLLIVANQGKANVNNGVVYLDLADTYDVLVHELAHLVGFIDEYPLSDDLAQRACYPNVDAPNLIIKMPIEEGEGEDDIEEVPFDFSYWQQFEHPIRLASARTCDNHLMQAFKPVSRLTFMEYYDTAYIPPLYLTMWQHRINNQEGIVPAYLGLAQASEASQNLDGAVLWWKALREFEPQALAP